MSTEQPSLDFLGLQNGYRLAVTYEEELRNGNTNLKHDFNNVLKVIENYITTI